jgi:formylglycine-generating enzyme required for sulfatase activity
MSDAFISYRRLCSGALATALQSKLESKYGYKVYVDNREVDATRVQFPERLRKAIADAPVFICLLGENEGQNTLQSDWVLSEIEQAYALKKFCIPVFQESYQPLPDMPPSVEYLLNFDGVHVFDRRTVMIDESFHKIAQLMQPHLNKGTALQRMRLYSPRFVSFMIIYGLVCVLLAIGLSLALNPDRLTSLRLALFPTEAASATDPVTATVQTATLTPGPSLTPTSEQSLTPAVTATSFDPMDIFAAAELLLQQTAQAQATLITATPTQGPNITASIEAIWTEWAVRTATHSADGLTATATHWTPTPTATLSPEQNALVPITRNADWTPVERDFNGVSMVLVPTGRFFMGANRAGGEQVFNTPFWIDKYEVTNADYAEFIAAEGYTTPSYWTVVGWDAKQTYGWRQPRYWTGENWNQPDQPVVGVSWYEAQAYATWRGMALCTEAQWEYAARGPDGLIYPWGNVFNADKLVYGGNSSGTTAPVGSYANESSWVGAFDLSGNAFEWTVSEYHPYPYTAWDGRETISSSQRRVLRGGSWNSDNRSTRAVFRYVSLPGYRNNPIGFRLCQPAILSNILTSPIQD